MSEVSNEALKFFRLLGPASWILIYLCGAWALRRLARAAISRLEKHAKLAPELLTGLHRTLSTVITLVTLLLILQALGVSARVLWTAVTGFLAVVAIAFFAGWSVLSNTFCALLIVTTRLLRINDHVEVLENGEKPGLRGQVLDVSLIFTTLKEEKGSVLQIPNSLFFQRIVRRWQGQPPASPAPAPSSSEAAAAVEGASPRLAQSLSASDAKRP